MAAPRIFCYYECCIFEIYNKIRSLLTVHLRCVETNGIITRISINMENVFAQEKPVTAPLALRTVLHERGQEFWEMALHWAGHQSRTAEKIVADAFVHLWKRQPAVNNLLQLRLFLYETICLSSIYFLQTNACLSSYHELAHELLHQYTNTGERTLADELLLHNCLEQLEHLSLPPLARDIFRRYYVKGESLQHIGLALHIPARQVNAVQEHTLQQLINPDCIYALPHL